MSCDVAFDGVVRGCALNTCVATVTVGDEEGWVQVGWGGRPRSNIFASRGRSRV
jgi:hypothetical protein